MTPAERTAELTLEARIGVLEGLFQHAGVDPKSPGKPGLDRIEGLLAESGYEPTWFVAAYRVLLSRLRRQDFPA